MHCAKTIPLTLLALAVLASSAGAQGSAAANSWELTPYRIKVLLAVEAGGELSGHTEQELGAYLAARAANVVGGSWWLEAASAPNELRHAMLTSIATVGAEAIPVAALDSDKVMLVAIATSDRGFRIQARELDVATRLWNSTITSEVAQRQTLSLHTFLTVLKAFAPVARIESSDGQTATLRLRAAALGRRDKDLPALAPGIAFRPVLIKSDTSGVVTPGSAELVPWTYLAPTRTTASLVTCRMLTGLADAPIPEYHPHRQRWALAVSPSSDSTTLRLVSQAEPPEPLEGYDALDEQPAAAEGKPARIQPIGRSDRNGSIEVPPGPQAVRMLLIRRGELALARLPIVPGLRAELTVPLPASDQGLAIESSLAELEDALIDLVAKREVLAARVRGAAKGGDRAGGESFLKQLRDTAAADALAAKLDQQQQAIAAADAAAQDRLRAKLDGLKQLLEKFRSESPADKLEAELKAAAKP